MAAIRFGPWRPDLGIFAAGDARNCIRMTDGYRPLAGLADFGAQMLDSAPSLLVMARESAGTMMVYAGNETQLLRLNAATMSWDDVSSAAYTTADGRWRTVQWGNELVATNYVDPMQVIDLSAGTPFEDLAAEAPRAKFIAACGPHLVVGNTQDSLDGQKPNRIRWSGIEEIRAWEPSAETLADWQDQPDVGHLMGLTGGRQLVCLFEEGIVVGTLIGAPKAFRFDRVEGAQGCIEPNSVVQFRGTTYYLSRGGWQAFDGRQSLPIGMGKVNRWFFGDALFDALPRMSVAVDQQQKVIMWLYCGAGSDGVTPNHVLLYNYDENEFSHADITAQLLGAFATPGYTIDSIDDLADGGSIDRMPAPLDDPFYTGGVPIFGAFVGGKLNSLAGAPMQATLDTPFLELIPGRRAMVVEARETVEGDGTVTCQAITLDDKQRNARLWPVTAENRFGLFPIRAEGRHHKLRFRIGGAWRSAYGLDVEVQPMGGR